MNPSGIPGLAEHAETYLPLRFRAGRPFHAGAPWRAMEVGLKGMSKTLARR
jgi:hypothetical protein